MKKIISILLFLSLLLTPLAFAESATSQLQEMYAQAELLMATGDYAGAAAKFEAMGAYSDASQMTMYCKAIDAAETMGLYDIAIDAFKNLGDFKDSKQMATYYDGRKNQATADYIIGEDITAVSDGDLETANMAYYLAEKTFADLALFKDCLSRMSECKAKGKAIDAEQNARTAARRENNYQEALALEQQEKYEEASKIYWPLSIISYKDSKTRLSNCCKPIYEQACSHLNKGELERAKILFELLEKYNGKNNDSGSKIAEIEKREKLVRAVNEIKKGSRIIASTYAQGEGVVEDFYYVSTRQGKATLPEKGSYTHMNVDMDIPCGLYAIVNFPSQENTFMKYPEWFRDWVRMGIITDIKP